MDSQGENKEPIWLTCAIIMIETLYVGDLNGNWDNDCHFSQLGSVWNCPCNSMSRHGACTRMYFVFELKFNLNLNYDDGIYCQSSWVCMWSWCLTVLPFLLIVLPWKSLCYYLVQMVIELSRRVLGLSSTNKWHVQLNAYQRGQWTW